MKDLVSIGIPVYKRLNYLPHVLSLVRAQDYPFIELIVSDNGMNGQKVKDIISAHYDKPFTFRQNPSTVPLSTHFNQLVNEAAGKYFVLLCDDDEISSNYVSELVGLFEQNPRGSVAIAKQEIINEQGVIIGQSKDPFPNVLTGPDFIRAAWHTYEFGFQCFATFLSRTEDIKQSGGYPDFPEGNHIDNALLIRLCLNSYVMLSSRCAFRWRMYESSGGWSVSIKEFAQTSKRFLQFLDADLAIGKFASAHPSEWSVTKSYLVEMAWETYLVRWKDLYKNKLSLSQWVKAGFTMPFIPPYYRKVTSILLRSLMMAARSKINLRRSRPTSGV